MKNITKKLLTGVAGIAFAATGLTSCIQNDDNKKEREKLAILALILLDQHNKNQQQPVDPVDPGPTCTTGEGGRIDVGNSNSFFTRVIDPDTSETTSCSFKAQFNDGSEKTVFITADGNGQTVFQKDSCGNESTVAATEQDTFLAPEMLDQFFENISATNSPAANQIIPGDGETNEPTNATHVNNVRGIFACNY